MTLHELGIQKGEAGSNLHHWMGIQWSQGSRINGVCWASTAGGKFKGCGIEGQGERHINKLNPSVLSQMTIIFNSSLLCHHLSDTHNAHHFPFFLDIKAYKCAVIPSYTLSIHPYTVGNIMPVVEGNHNHVTCKWLSIVLGTILLLNKAVRTF